MVSSFSHLCRLAIIPLLVAGLISCSDDTDPPPGDAGVDQNVTEGGPGPDGGNAEDCTGMADGDACGEAGSGNICLKEACVTSTCGDGYVDSANEDCEDGNQVDGDGCTLCKYDCAADADCDDKNECNGTETCDTTAHTCQAGTPLADQTACTQADSSAGVCSGGACVAVGCGNGVKDTGEDCDDGNTVAGDGCELDCSFTCQADTDCDDQNLCTGKETCDTTTDPTKPVCVAGTAVTCQASASCIGTCDPATGDCTYPDADSDLVGCDTDCNDNDSNIFPGADECADGKDNDCDPSTPDLGAPDCKCYVDSDGDGYPPANAASIFSVVCATGYTRTAPGTGTTDCRDTRVDVNPGQTSWFTSSYCTKYIGGFPPICFASSWDYNCSGATETQYKNNHQLCMYIYKGCVGSGWTAATDPACGVQAKYTVCKASGTTCLKSEEMRKQGCH